MSYALGFLFILDEIGGWGQLGEYLIHGVNLPHRLQKQQESGQRQVCGGAILKLMDGGQADAALLGHLLLGQIAAQSVVLEPFSQQSHQFGSGIFV